MGQIFLVQNAIITQEKDGQIWNSGTNTIIFDEPFADNNYVFIAHSQDSNITWDNLNKTETGITINSSSNTNKGYYRAIGNSNEYRTEGLLSMGIGANGKVQRGKKSLVSGVNTIIFANPFTSLDYTFSAIGNDVMAFVVEGSKQLDSIQVYSADDNPNFEYIAIGI